MCPIFCMYERFHVVCTVTVFASQSDPVYIVLWNSLYCFFVLYVLSLNSYSLVNVFVYVLDWAWVDWGDECWPPYGPTGIHVWPGLERPLGDIHSELAAVHWWSATADAPVAGGSVQSGFRGAVHIRKALPSPPPTFWPVQPRAASPSLRRRGDQRPWYNELWTGRPAVGTILWCRNVSVQPAQTGKCDEIISPLLRTVLDSLCNLKCLSLSV